MARSINLLPPELSPKKIFAVIGRKIKAISIVGYVLLIITIASSSIGFLIFSRRLETLTAEQDKLEQDLGNLKKSEATVVILKDRADKSKEIFDSNLTRSSVELFNNLKSQTPTGIEFTDLTVENKEILVSATALNSKDLESFVTYLISSGIYGKIRLTEMSLNINGGYTVSFAAEI
jgi:Tfp pilus assembly protein PilN